MLTVSYLPTPVVLTEHVNSWTRRDSSSSKKSAPPSTGKRRHRDSVSPARSRSPAESYHSRRSYRSRSRSLDTPKRRRRDDSPPRSGRSPSHSGRNRGREIRRDGRYSRSPPSSISSRGRGRRRSSSASSYSRSRSRSPTQSPRDRPRAKHRLPPVSAVREVPIIKGGFRNGQNRNRKGGNKNINGKLSEVRAGSYLLVHIVTARLAFPRTS